MARKMTRQMARNRMRIESASAVKNSKRYIINKESDPIELYLKQVSNFPHKKEMIQSNLRLVVSIAKNYQNRGVSLPDLINEGKIALINAVERFDYTRNRHFSTYCAWCIRQSILKSIAGKRREIRTPVRILNGRNRSIRIGSCNIGLPFKPVITPEHDIVNENVEVVFREHYGKWYDETKYLSSPKMFENKHYRDIISLGGNAVPCIIKKLKEEPAHLFKALFEITGQDPVPESHWGDIEQMALDWVNWWEDKER